MATLYEAMKGHACPKDVAYMISNGRNGLQRVTYADIKAARIKRQKEHLGRVLACNGPMRRAAYLWTFYVPGFLYGGWHLYIRTIEGSWWIRAGRPFDSDWDMVLEFMRIYPCGLLPIRENFEDWKVAFAKAHTHGKRGGKPQGVIYGWTYSCGPNDRPRRFEA